MRVALVYDRVNKIGGAERVLVALHQIWPEAPLYTLVYHPRTAPWATNWKVIPSVVQYLPFARANHEWYFWLASRAFESFDFSSFDVVISVTSAEAKAIITPPTTLHICYLLTPTKYLWSHTHAYRHASPLKKAGDPFVSFFLSSSRRTDYLSAQRPDKIIAISQTVAARCQKYYRRLVDAIMYPPVDIEKFAKPVSAPQEKDYYLIVSRLVPSKNLDLAIRACNQLRKPLVVIGEGKESARLKRLAGPTIIFKGRVEEDELVSYYQHCRAVIFPQEEDFGIVALEAQAAGKPVIAYGKGGATETVIPGKTGVFFSNQKVPSIISRPWSSRADNTSAERKRGVDIIEALETAARIPFNPSVIKKNAQRFTTKRFKTQFRKFVETQWQSHQKVI